MSEGKSKPKNHGSCGFSLHPYGEGSGRGSILKVFLIISGTVCLVLGVIGIFIPLLPTTPFLLLSAAAYFRGSERLYGWLINHKYLYYHLLISAGKTTPNCLRISSNISMVISVLLWLLTVDSLRPDCIRSINSATSKKYS